MAISTSPVEQISCGAFPLFFSFVYQRGLHAANQVVFHSPGWLPTYVIVQILYTVT